MQICKFQDLSGDDQQLVDAAVTVRENAFARYSCFPVGAALRVRDGRQTIFTGCNVETSAFIAKHAEAVAITNMITHCGSHPKPIVDVMVVALMAPHEDLHALPCGHCRQDIIEFGFGETRIIGACLNKQGIVWRVEIATLDELLPLGFTSHNLTD